MSQNKKQAGLHNQDDAAHQAHQAHAANAGRADNAAHDASGRFQSADEKNKQKLSAQDHHQSADRAQAAQAHQGAAHTQTAQDKAQKKQ
jgi:hypothetical protein